MKLFSCVTHQMRMVYTHLGHRHIAPGESPGPQKTRSSLGPKRPSAAASPPSVSVTSPSTVSGSSLAASSPTYEAVGDLEWPCQKYPKLMSFQGNEKKQTEKMGSTSGFGFFQRKKSDPWFPGDANSGGEKSGMGSKTGRWWNFMCSSSLCSFGNFT